MKNKFRIFLVGTLCVVSFTGLTGCLSSTSAPVAVSDQQTTIANAVEDALSIGLVPVLTKNPSYVPAAQSVAIALGTLGGDSLQAVDVEAILAKTTLAPDDARTVAALVNAAWDTYSRRYAAQVSTLTRPDVRLFLTAVSNGITRAVAALPAQS